MRGCFVSARCRAHPGGRPQGQPSSAWCEKTPTLYETTACKNSVESQTDNRPSQQKQASQVNGSACIGTACCGRIVCRRGRNGVFAPRATQDDHDEPVAPNWLAKVPSPDRPDQVHLRGTLSKHANLDRPSVAASKAHQHHGGLLASPSRRPAVRQLSRNKATEQAGSLSCSRTSVSRQTSVRTRSPKIKHGADCSAPC